MRLKAFVLFSLIYFSYQSIKAQVLPSFGNTRTGTSGMQFLKIPLDARSAAMGGAFTAVCDDASATIWNPAGMIRSANKTEVLFGSLAWFAGANSQYASAFTKYKSHTRYGFFVQSLNYAKMKETTEFQPTGTGRTFTPVSQQIGFSYCRQLTDQFSFGVNTKWAHEGIAGVAINNVMFDLGLRYDLDIKHMRFAVTVNNFGVNVKPSGQIQTLKFSGDETISDFQAVSVPGIFRLGFAYDPIHKGDHRLTASGQLNHYTDNNETIAIGFEYAWRNILYFRTGYEFGVDEGGLPALGMGVRLKKKYGNFGFDYSFNNKKLLGNVHRLGIVLAFLSSKPAAN
ncbi:MAG: PorV/PorQ family protein [Bacteroidetes bacterium]|nr:PorV/PorQ family protein [Bacteroidota bacterium]